MTQRNQSETTTSWGYRSEVDTHLTEYPFITLLLKQLFCSNEQLSIGKGWPLAQPSLASVPKWVSPETPR
jgi:hypothetical protein